MKQKARNSVYTKQYNRKLILRIIQSGSVSRADIARQTGLTRATITIIVDELIKEGTVCELGIGKSAMGRKPILLSINPEAAYAIGLYLSRDICTLGLINLGGTVVYKKNVDLSSFKDADSALVALNKEIETIISKAGSENKVISGIGISAPGPLDVVNGTIINPPNFEMWHNFNIAQKISERFDIKTVLNNNSSAQALTEKYYGKGKKLTSFITLIITSGVGSAIVINSKIFRGFGGFGSEIGHSSINADGEKCSCGNYGCLELYASIPQVIDYAKKHCESSIASWEDIVDKAEAGDKKCLEIIDRQANYLSAAIVNTINMIHIENVIIAGYVSYKPELLKAKIDEYVNSRIMNKGSVEVNIIFSDSKDPDVLAAATVAFESTVF